MCLLYGHVFQVIQRNLELCKQSITYSGISVYTSDAQIAQ